MTSTTTTAEWKRSKAQTPLTVPSGKTCLARPVGLDTLLAQGTIPNSLLDIVQSALSKGKAGKADEVDEARLFSEVMRDQSKIRDVFALADAVTMACVVEPEVHPVPARKEDGSEGDRDPELLYVDEVDLDDKMFIMSFAMGGPKDLETFRKETGIGVGSVPERQDVGV